MNEIQQIRADVEMVEDALGGSAAGRNRLAERLQCIPRILVASNNRLGKPLSPHDIADVSQDTTLIVLRKLEAYEGRSSIEGWIYRICVLELMNAVRRKRRQPHTTENIVECAERSTQPNSSPKDLGNLIDVHDALEKIQSDEAEVIRLKHFDDLTFDQIGGLKGQPPSTIKSRYYRGMLSLEAMLAHERK